MEKPEAKVADIVYVGIMSGGDGKSIFSVYVHFYKNLDEYLCTIYKDKKEVGYRLHKTSDSVIETYKPFFGQKEIDGLKFRK